MEQGDIYVVETMWERIHSPSIQGELYIRFPYLFPTKKEATKNGNKMIDNSSTVSHSIIRSILVLKSDSDNYYLLGKQQNVFIS